MRISENASTIFALDIGTRSVIGLLLQKINHEYELIDVCIKEHGERSMLDGQIHNVLSVSEVISDIKETLEAKHGPLKKVCVAAAGRSLKTQVGKVEIDLLGKTLADSHEILHLELSAVQQAQFELAQEHADKKNFQYYCVGYSVTNYFLDGERIGSLLDQTGTKASLEVIATFLPNVVVDSLLAALTRANLELEALTLEPIAAINVLIPPSMRRLNVALVDIGAGTSDIALTEDGTITAYGMVPIAGDEVTEAISDHYLLDFPEAEEVKRSLADNEEIILHDILGFETIYKKNEILDEINETIEQLAREITNEIIQLNQKPPKAVMLVGGGSMTPNLAAYIARFLQLPENRVAIRGIDAIKALQPLTSIKPGPELVTPIGIAIAAKEHPIDYISATVNERQIRLFDVKKLTVGDAILASGIELSKLYGKPGMAMMVTVNEQLISIPGQHGRAPILIKNGEPTTLDTPLVENDSIYVERGEDGLAATATIGDLVSDIPSTQITLNHEQLIIPAIVYKNGQLARLDEVVNDRDNLTVTRPKTVQEILQVSEKYHEIRVLKPFIITVDKKQIAFPSLEAELRVNGILSDLSSPIKNGDKVTIDQIKRSVPLVSDLLTKIDMRDQLSISVFFNDEPITITKNILKLYRGEMALNENDPLIYGEALSLQPVERSPFIFQDIFLSVEIDLTPQPNKRLIIKKNGKNASFSEQIQTGDKLEVRLVPIENETTSNGI